MVTDAVDAVGSSVTTISPETSVKLPRTLLTIRCRATKPTRVWVGSMVNVPGCGMVTPFQVRVFGSFDVTMTPFGWRRGPRHLSTLLTHQPYIRQSLIDQRV